jgi:ribosome-binding protein aMBF1 (putative translation factor)
MDKLARAQKELATLRQLKLELKRLKEQYDKQVKIVGRAIRESREEQGISLRAAAKAIGISAPYLSDIEKGRRGIPDFIYWIPR